MFWKYSLNKSEKNEKKIFYGVQDNKLVDEKNITPYKMKKKV